MLSTLDQQQLPRIPNDGLSHHPCKKLPSTKRQACLTIYINIVHSRDLSALLQHLQWGGGVVASKVKRYRYGRRNKGTRQVWNVTHQLLFSHVANLLGQPFFQWILTGPSFPEIPGVVAPLASCPPPPFPQTFQYLPFCFS